MLHHKAASQKQTALVYRLHSTGRAGKTVGCQAGGWEPENMAKMLRNTSRLKARCCSCWMARHTSTNAKAVGFEDSQAVGP
jgi:hypothetical protein